MLCCIESRIRPEIKKERGERWYAHPADQTVYTLLLRMNYNTSGDFLVKAIVVEHEFGTKFILFPDLNP